MRALFDVSMLLALLDFDHIHHTRARAFWDVAKDHGWATCPITQNGFVRILSQPSYPNRISSAHAIAILGRATETAGHEFWTDDVSITDSSIFTPDLVSGPRQVSDLYLLALALSRGGRLVTLDRTIVIDAVVGATSENLVAL